LSAGEAMRDRILRAALTLLLATPFAGCAAMEAPAAAGEAAPGAAPPAAKEPLRRVESFRREASQAPSAPADPDEAARSSLWSDKSPFLFTDRRASRVGDVITVVISESSNTKKEADTEVKRKANLAYTIPALPGYGRILATPTTGRGRRFNPDDTLRAASSNDHQTESEIERTDTLSATIAARVVEIFPNGNLFVEGRREITTHKETLIVTVSGIVRPEDIDQNNTIQSKNIADAKIVYTGDGILAEAQSPGWLSRIVNILWPF